MNIQRASVVDAIDPEGHGRWQVSILSSGSVLWAPHVIPVAAFTSHEVEVGTAVWVAFEDGDASRPVILGLIDPPSRRGSRARDLEAMGDAWDRGHAAGTTDAAGGVTPNPYR